MKETESNMPSEIEILEELNRRIKYRRLEKEDKIFRSAWYKKGFQDACKWLRELEKSDTNISSSVNTQGNTYDLTRKAKPRSLNEKK